MGHSCPFYPQVDLMASMIAYPDLIFSDDWLNMLYAGVSCNVGLTYDHKHLDPIIRRSRSHIHRKVQLIQP